MQNHRTGCVLSAHPGFHVCTYPQGLVKGGNGQQAGCEKVQLGLSKDGETDVFKSKARVAWDPHSVARHILINLQMLI